MISLHDIHKDYQSGSITVSVLKKLNLEITAGEFVALSGPSGSGKSTLCNLISLIDRPTSGHIEFDGTDIASLGDDALSRIRGESVGIVFQSFNLIPVLSAVENVMLPAQLLGWPGKASRDAAVNGLHAVGLADLINQRPSELSGGQQQRVALARALVTRPKLVIADEPTANLDSKTAHEMIKLMQNINESSGATFLFATHDDRLLTRVRRRISLEDGCIASDHLME